MPEIHRPDPPYMQVVAVIREQIRSGDLKPGDHVPSARQITTQWGISLATATKVLAALRSEGLARGVAGVGTVVVAPAADSPKDHLAAIRMTGRIYPSGGYARITAADEVQAPDDVADALGLAAGSHVIRRERITFQGDQPVSTSVSWFDASLAEQCPLLLERERIPAGTAAYIETQTGRTVTRGRDKVGATIADETHQAALGIRAGDAVLTGQNWYFDANGDVVEFGQYTTAGDRGWFYDYSVQ